MEKRDKIFENVSNFIIYFYFTKVLMTLYLGNECWYQISKSKFLSDLLKFIHF